MNRLDVVELIENNKINHLWIEPDRFGLSNTLCFFANHTITIYFEEDVMVCFAIDDIKMYPNDISLDQGNLTLYLGENKIASIQSLV